MNFANNLKNLRELHDVTQEELAKYLKVTRPTVAGYETKDHQPDYEKLESIAEFFSVSIDYLITGRDSERISPAKEGALDKEILRTSKELTLTSKQDLLKYIRLLKLRDEHEK